MSVPTLRGIAWNHSRAFPALVATAQRFEELFPPVRIHWEKRTLHEFGHMSLTELAGAFDLLVVDHPMMGDAFSTGALSDLSAVIPASALTELQSDSLGPSFETYRYEGCLFALPIDAAAPAASYRGDLLRAAQAELPHTWDDLIALAQRGLVVMPGFPADLFLNFMGIYVSLGGSFFPDGELSQNQSALLALDLLRQLAAHMPSDIYVKNPINIYEELGSGSSVAYCPFAYTYSNYARDGFTQNPIDFTLPVTLDGLAMRTVLGGTGIAISSRCAMPEVAASYCQCVSSANWQRTIYALSGGQPARHSSWDDPVLNALTRNFFRQTRSSIENAYTRPRYPGYAAFQERAGIPLVHFLRDGRDSAKALAEIQRLYLESQGRQS